jgi:hypothetical protein
VQARFELEDGKPRRVFVRFEPTAKGRWKAVEWSIPGYPADVLRQVPYQRIMRAVQASDEVKEVLNDRLAEPAEEGFRHAFGVAVRDEPIVITRPKGRNLDDNFYGHVAYVYRQAIGKGLNPRQAIAEAAGVAPDTAGRWIYQARKRGFIPKTTPGKVTT